MGAEVVPGLQLLEGAGRWAASFREAGLVAGQRLVVALPTDVPLAQVLIAGLWEGLTLVPVAPGTDLATAAAAADATAAVVVPDATSAVRWAWSPGGSTGPGRGPATLRPAGEPTPHARLLCLQAGQGPWAALVDDNVEHAVDGLLGALHPSRARWLSVLPWHAPAGLLLDLLPSLLGADLVVRPTADDEPTVQDVANTVERWQPTHTVLPLELVSRMLRHWGNLEPLTCVIDGLASGPGAEPELATQLRGTRLRTHRGPPELSCLATLGEPGIWRPGALGRPVGCEIADGEAGGFLVSGRAVAGGRWEDGQLHRVDRRFPIEVPLR